MSSSRTNATAVPYILTPSLQWDGNDGRWSSFLVQVGTPGQGFRVLPSTSGSQLHLPFSGGCLPTDPQGCPNLRGVEYLNGFPSTGFDIEKSSTWKTVGTYSLDLDTNLNFNSNALFGFDTISLGIVQQQQSVITLSGQNVAGVQSKNWFLGVLGLNTRPSQFSNEHLVPSLLQSLRNQSLIPSLSYSYTAGAAYPERNEVGSLILGGFDRSRGVPSANSISFATDDYRAPVVGVESIFGVNTLDGAMSFSTTGTFLAAIDSSVPHMWLPRPVCDAFEQGFGLTYDNATELYLVKDNVHAQLKSLNPNVTFEIGNGTRNSGKTAQIVLPYAAFDLSASWPIYNESTKYFPLKRAENESQYTLGRVILQEAYLIVDFERQNFTLTQVLFPDAHTPPQITAILSMDNSRDRPFRLAKGAIAGIAVGAVAVVMVISLLVRGLRRQLRLQAGRRLESTINKIEPDLGCELEHNHRYEIEAAPGELPLGTETQEMEARELPQELENNPMS